MLEELEIEIPKAFETEGYTRHRDQVLPQLEQQRREKLAQIDRHATESGFKLLKGPGGLMLVPRQATNCSPMRTWSAPDQVGEYLEGSLHWAVVDRLGRSAGALNALSADEKKAEPVAV